MKRKHKKIIVSVIVIILAFLILLYVKIIPSVMVNKAVAAIDSNNVSTFERYYNLPNYSPFGFARKNVESYLEDQESAVADEINEKFQNFETKDEIKKYIKQEHAVIYYYCLSDGYVKYMLDGKQRCIEIKNELDEVQQNIKLCKSNISANSEYTIDEATNLKLDIQHCKASIYAINAQAQIVNDDLTYINKIKPIIENLNSDIAELEQKTIDL